jgi:hypothetical protein
MLVRTDAGARGKPCYKGWRESVSTTGSKGPNGSLKYHIPPQSESHSPPVEGAPVHLGLRYSCLFVDANIRLLIVWSPKLRVIVPVRVFRSTHKPPKHSKTASLYKVHFSPELEDAVMRYAKG